VSAIDPQNNAQVSLVGQLQMLFAFLLFLDQRPSRVPPARGPFVQVPSLLGGGVSPALAGDLSRRGRSFRLGLSSPRRSWAPSSSRTWCWAWIARTVPQINLLIVGFPITIALTRRPRRDSPFLRAGRGGGLDGRLARQHGDPRVGEAVNG
jgi:hypothetical protein